MSATISRMRNKRPTHFSRADRQSLWSVILSAASAVFFPARFAGRADAKSKDLLFVDEEDFGRSSDSRSLDYVRLLTSRAASLRSG